MRYSSPYTVLISSGGEQYNTNLVCRPPEDGSAELDEVEEEQSVGDEVEKQTRSSEHNLASRHF